MDINLPHIDSFFKDLQNKHYSDETLYNYERDLLTFEQFLRNKSISFEKVSRSTVEIYQEQLKSADRKTAKGVQSEQHYSVGSINRTLSSLRRYLKYLVETDWPTPITPEAVRLLKTSRLHIQIAESDALIKLVESPLEFEKDSKVALRNRAMLETLFATGMRISELLSLNKNQLDKSGKIFIRGKGKKERFVYLTDRAQTCIRKYLDTRDDDEYPALFIPYRGQNAGTTKARISTNYLQMKIKRYKERLGINVPTSAHSLRHGFATYMAEQGANPAALQILFTAYYQQICPLGHEASDKYAEKTHKQFHPLK